MGRTRIFGELMKCPCLILTLLFTVLIVRETSPVVSEGSQEDISTFLGDYRLGRLGTSAGADKISGGTLDAYITRAPLNGNRFASYPEYIENRLHGATITKMLPEEVSRRLSKLAEEAGYATDSPDSRALVLLARYHARKTLAGAGLALYYATGDLSALQMARSNAAAAFEIWERLATSPARGSAALGKEDWREGTACVRYDLIRLDELQRVFDNYMLFDVGLDFGPATKGGTQGLKGRIGRLSPESPYSRLSGYGWFEGKGITSSPPIADDNCSSMMESGESVRILRLFAGSYLKGSARSTLIVDLRDGEYRIVTAVANQAEVASGSFVIRTADATGEPVDHISYAAGETGDKSMDVVVRGGRLVLIFVPEPPGDWLLSGLVIARRSPHIAHLPILEATQGARTNFSATITAPDGIAAADLHLSFNGRSLTLPMLHDRFQYEATVTWPDNLEQGSYYLTARDNAGHSGQWPAGPPRTVRLRQPQPAAP